MGTPRETLRLVARDDGPVRMMTTRTRHRSHRCDGSAGRAGGCRSSREEDLSGYVLKKDSPSCGMERVKVFGRWRHATAQRPRHLRGGVARAVSQPAGRGRGPALRSAAARELHRAGLRVSSVCAASSHRAGRSAASSPSTPRTRCRCSSHSTDELPAARPDRRAAASKMPREALRRELRVTLHGDAAHRRDDAPAHQRADAHGRAPEEAARFGSKAELTATIDEYRRGLVPLVVPLTLLRHHVRVHDISYLSGQTYLEPHPRELMLRNRV